MTKHNVYIAGPFFNPEQVERVEYIKKVLDENEITYFSPKDSVILKPDATPEERKKVFQENLDMIDVSDCIVAITNDKDPGTLFEAGYAYGTNTPIVYFVEGLSGKFNVMLAESAVFVCESREAFEDQGVKAINSIRLGIWVDKTEYEGEIQ